MALLTAASHSLVLNGPQCCKIGANWSTQLGKTSLKKSFGSLNPIRAESTRKKLRLVAPNLNARPQFLRGGVGLERLTHQKDKFLPSKRRSGFCRASSPDPSSSPTQLIEPELQTPSVTPPQTAPSTTPPPENGSPRPPPDNFPAWARTVDQCSEHFSVDLKRGLASGQVAVYREAYGWNELEKEPGKPFWELVAEQFDDALVKILLGAAAVSGALAVWDAAEAGEPVGADDFLETLVILLIIVLNAVIGVWQESKAESTLAALKEMQSETARVIRDGREIPDLPARELVPGDLVELRVGDKAPADIRLVELRSATLRAQQSSLTGESQPVSKDTHVVPQEDIELQGKECIVFAGSGIANGTAVGVVVHTGMRTEIGKIQEQIQQASQEGYDTPLTRKLDDFADLLTKVVGAVCVLVWVINYKYFLSFDADATFPANIRFDFQQCAYYFKVAVALAVAAIPEGLPAVITTCLALGTKRMAQENAIVRRLPSVETLGCTSVICSDKTGTLTTNQMSVVRLVSVGFTLGELREYVVEGTTYDPADGGVVGLPVEGGGLDKNLEALAEIAAVCNDAGLSFKKGKYGATGMPTEAALKVLVEKLGVSDQAQTQGHRDARAADPDTAALGTCQQYKDGTSRLATLEFDRNRKSMSVVCTSSALFGLGGNRLLVKGAAECVLARCTKVLLSSGLAVPLSDDVRPQILAAVDRITSRGLRCLAFGVKTNLGDLSGYDGSEEHPGQALLRDSDRYEEIESDLTFVGLAGLQDPPRKEVLPALAECKKAGIHVIVITGDNKNTAEAICREIGLFTPDENLAEKSMTGGDFMRLPEGGKRAVLLEGLKSGTGLVFSRAEPVHKQEIVRLLKAGGHVVAMTGDGVNDAPALKSADIGIAMGISGTEVAKEASDMILADDDFATIVSAVREGRSIYDNMKSFIRYLISSNIGEVVSIFLAAALGLPQGLIPVQLLWVNLVTDGAPATALGFNPPEEGIMERAPRSRDEGLVSGWLFVRYSVIGAYVGIATVAAFGIWYLFPSFLGIDLSGDGHTILTFGQLSSWGTCPTWPDFHVAPYTAGALTVAMDNPCDYFTTGKVKASTLAMSTLVLIEMFNALNALSENNSLLTTKPWVNKWLLLAIGVSLGLHFLILSVPFLQEAFGVVPLSLNEWLLVLVLSAPIIAIDEVLKFAGRKWFSKPGSEQ